MAKQVMELSEYLTKPATPLQERFARYLQEEVGYDPTAAKTKLEAFQEGVRLATATRMIFQASDFNRNEREELKASKAEAPAETPAPAKAAKAAPAKATPAKAAKPTKAAKAGADATEGAPAPKPTRRRGAAPAAATNANEAPF